MRADIKAIRDEIALLRGDLAALRLWMLLDQQRGRVEIRLGKPIVAGGLPPVARELKLGGVDLTRPYVIPDSVRDIPSIGITSVGGISAAEWRLSSPVGVTLKGGFLPDET